MKKVSLSVLTLACMTVMAGCNSQEGAANVRSALGGTDTVNNEAEADNAVGQDTANPDSSEAETEANTADLDTPELNITKADTETDSAAENTSDSKSDSTISGKTGTTPNQSSFDTDNTEIFTAFVRDEILCEEQTYSVIYTDAIDTFEEEPVTYLYDYDKDGAEELVVENSFFGYDIYDVENGEVVRIEERLEKDSLSPEEMQKFAVDRSYRFPDGAVVNKDTVYEQYEKLVATLMPQNWDGFQLIDFDNDGIPELIATNANENRPDPGMQPYLVVGHNDEELVRNPILEDGVASAGGYRGTLYYLPDTGKFLHATISAPLGIPADYVYQLVEGAVVEIESGYFEVDQDSYSDDSDWDPMEHGTWYWGGQEVTEEKYTEYFKAATENTKGIALGEIDYVDKDAILKLLAE